MRLICKEQREYAQSLNYVTFADEISLLCLLVV